MSLLEINPTLAEANHTDHQPAAQIWGEVFHSTGSKAPTRRKLGAAPDAMLPSCNPDQEEERTDFTLAAEAVSTLQ